MKKSNQGKVNFLTVQEARNHFIEDAFNKSVCQLASKENKLETDGASEQPREWPKLELLRSIEQHYTQDQMRLMCESIQNNVVSDLDAVPKHKYTVVDFAKESQAWDEQVFSLGSMTVSFKALGGIHEDFDFHQNDRLNATIYVRSENRAAQAFLKAKGNDGEEYFFELEYFCMIYHLSDNDDRETDDSSSENEKTTGETGMFTLFNRSNDLMFITTY